MIHQSVERKEKLHLLKENLSKRIDTLIVGPIGIGKSHLLAQARCRPCPQSKNPIPNKRSPHKYCGRTSQKRKTLSAH